MNNLATASQLPDMTFYFISGSLPNEYGGLTKSLILRSKLFGELGGKKSYFLTYQFDIELRDKTEDLYLKKRIDPRLTSVINLYDNYLSDISVGKRIYTEKIEIEKLIKRKNANKFMKKINTIFLKFDTKHEIAYYESSTNVKNIDFKDDNNHLYKKEEYRKDGSLATVSYYNQGTNHPYLIEYINNDNIVYLDKSFMLDNQTKDFKLANITWYSDNGLINFKNESHMRRHWLEYLQSFSNDPKLFLVDSRHQDRHLFNVKKKPNSYYACIIHSKHFENTKEEIKKSYHQLMENRLLLDGLFFITKEQKSDFENLTGKQINYFYTPHSLENELSTNVLNVNRQPLNAVIISRFSGIKNIIDAVKAFQYVVSEIPNATLNIFGSGTQEVAIKSKIIELGLERNVFLRGYTNDPNHEFQKASLTISTSKFEGFGLSNMEAIGNGCPVVTYDYDYGAKSLVINNENGFIVKQGDTSSLASNIIKIMENQDIQNTLSKNAIKTARNFTPTAYIKNWSTSLTMMIDISNKKQIMLNKLKTIDFRLIDLKQNENSFQFNILFDTNYSFSLSFKLILLDRKLKMQIASSNLLPTGTDGILVATLSDLTLESLILNNSNTIDFYVEVSDDSGINTYKRIKAEDKLRRKYVYNSNELNSYVTTYGNYSWSLV